MKQPFSHLRLQKELETLVLRPEETLSTEMYPDGRAQIKYTLLLTDGIYKDHKYTFTINIPKEYPFTPPKPICTTKVLHPSIDSLGRVCLNITREDWSVQQSIQTIIFGLSSIFYNIPRDNPLNQVAYSWLLQGDDIFKREAIKVYNSNNK
ncbi:ubiquitin-conjugating enzyme E2 M [Nematocida sp. AWRm80]|nr:ubiquitin-conjugating enzyme E2 M [Nematocida sp. AWRm80]